MRAIKSRDTNTPVLGAKEKKIERERKVLARVESLQNISDDIARASTDVIVPSLTNGQLLAVLAQIFNKEAQRVLALKE